MKNDVKKMLAVRNSVDESERHMRLSQNLQRSSLSRGSSAGRSQPRSRSPGTLPVPGREELSLSSSFEPTPLPPVSFDRVDRNRDGVISRDELRHYNYSKQPEPEHGGSGSRCSAVGVNSALQRPSMGPHKVAERRFNAVSRPF